MASYVRLTDEEIDKIKNGGTVSAKSGDIVLTRDDGPERMSAVDFVQVAKGLLKNKDFKCFAENKAFVLNEEGTWYVGKQVGDQWYVAEIEKKSEVVGRSEARIETRENTYVEADLYEGYFVQTPNQGSQFIEYLNEWFESVEYSEKIGTGCVNGYRRKTLEDLIDNTFKYTK